MNGAQVLAAGAGIDVSATTVRNVTIVTVGVAGGLAAAGAGISVTNINGDTTANVGNVAVGSTTPVEHISVIADSNVDIDVFAVSVQGGGIALSAAIAVTTTSGTTSANLGANGSVGAGGIHVSANGTHAVNVLAINIAVGAFALGATVAIAANDRVVLATMSATASLSTTGAVSVIATSSDTAIAFTPGGGGGGVSISVMVPVASVSGATRARVDGDITSSTSITVQATGKNIVEAKADVGSLAVFGISGAVASATIKSDADIEAIVGSASTLQSSGAVLVDAHHVDDGNKAYARARLISGGAFGSFGIMVSLAEINGGVAARLNGDVTGSSSVDVTASGVNFAEAFSLVISVGITASLAGAGSLAEIGSGADVEATVGLTSTVASSGDITVTALSDYDADSESHIGSGGLVSIAVAVPQATIDGGTRAQFAGNVTSGASLTVVALGDYDADAKSIPVSIGLLSIMAAAATAEITSGAQVEAHIGPDDSLVAGASPRTINVTGAIRVHATAPMVSTAMASGVNIGGVIALSIMLPTATVNGSVKAYVRDGTAITGSLLEVLAQIVDNPSTGADETAPNPFTATATTFVLGFGGIAAGAGANAEATVTGTVEAFVGAPVGITPGGDGTTVVNVTGTVKVEALSLVTATAKADGGGASGALTVTAMIPHADAGGTTRAFIGQGANVSATSVEVNAEGTFVSSATTIAVSIAGLAAINVVNANADVTGVVDAHIGSAVGETAHSTPTVVVARTGAVTVDAWASMSATATANGGGVAGGVTVNVMLPTATVAGIVRAYVGDSVTLTAKSLTVTANAPTMKADSTTKVGAVAAFGGVNGVEADAFVTGVVEAFIGAHRDAPTSAFEPSINVGAGDVTVSADSYMFALAVADGVAGSA
ncbi:MAG: hypothetical protein QNM02_09510, partial [Acidimicrobiia bacterium]|nr:hypothetical protein [Acidimicrobiia bacterium]